LTVLLLFAPCKMSFWWLVTWLDLTLKLESRSWKRCHFSSEVLTLGAEKTWGYFLLTTQVTAL
jgi:hypothetical protein